MTREEKGEEEGGRGKKGRKGGIDMLRTSNYCRKGSGVWVGTGGGGGCGGWC